MSEIVLIVLAVFALVIASWLAGVYVQMLINNYKENAEYERTCEKIYENKEDE